MIRKRFGEISLATQAARFVTCRDKCMHNRNDMYFNKMSNPRFSVLEQTIRKRKKTISSIEPSECPQLKNLGNVKEPLRSSLKPKNARAMYKAK